MNNLCYHYEKLNNNKSLFPFIDCCYIITLENSKYEKRIRYQLKKYPLCKKIVIQWNKGYKNCSKKLNIQNTVQDIIDSNKTLLNDAIINNYNNILILEEDFIINKHISDTNIRKEISEFILENNPKIFLFGSVLWKTSNKTGNFTKVDLKLGNHAVLYNREGIREYYNKLLNNNYDCSDNITNSINDKYAYKIPLIIQVFSGTENQNNWHNHFKDEEKGKFMVNIYVWFLTKLGFTNEKEIVRAYEENYKTHFDDRYFIQKKIYNFISNFADNNLTY